MPTTPYVSRINQIDARILDDEIYNLLKTQTKSIAQHFTPGTADEWQPEINALLKSLIWYYSVGDGKSTFGQRLLNLHYGSLNGKTAILHLVLTVLPAYVQAKFLINRPLSSSERINKLRYYLQRIISAVNVLELINLIIFLHRGRQPYLIERILGISSQSLTTHRPRSIGYSYMTRELLWHGLIELFSIGLPMINFHYIKQFVKQMTSTKKAHGIKRTFPIMTLSTKCAYCNDTPVMPTHAGCEHIFCYYCLKAHFTAMQRFNCPLCDMELNAHNLKYYVVESAPS